MSIERFVKTLKGWTMARNNFLFLLMTVFLCSCANKDITLKNLLGPNGDGNSSEDSDEVRRDPILVQSEQSIMLENDEDDVESAASEGYEHLVHGEWANNLYFGYWDYPQYEATYSSFRFFLKKAIPKGAKVIKAFLDIRGTGSVGWNSQKHFLEISATDSKSSPQISEFSDVIGKNNGYQETQTIIRWPKQGGLDWNEQGLNRTPDLSALIQELVDKYDGLDKGSSITLWLKTSLLERSAEVMAADYGHKDFHTQLSISAEYKE